MSALFEAIVAGSASYALFTTFRLQRDLRRLREQIGADSADAWPTADEIEKINLYTTNARRRG